MVNKKKKKVTLIFQLDRVKLLTNHRPESGTLFSKLYRRYKQKYSRFSVHNISLSRTS